MKTLNIAVIGCGFMGRTHSNAFSQVPHFFDVPVRPVLKAVCARSKDRAEKFAAKWGYDSYETDWRKLIERKDIDLIDIASPNDTHAEIAVAAAQAGKMVLSEKPLGRTPAESEAMVEAVEKANVPNMVWYNYRRVPAVMLAKHLIDEAPWENLSLPDGVLAGLDDLKRSSAGRRRPLAAGCIRSRQRSNGRSAGA